MTEAEAFDKSIRKTLKATLIPVDDLIAALAVFQKVKKTNTTKEMESE